MIFEAYCEDESDPGLVAEYDLDTPRRAYSLRKAISLWLEDASSGLTTRSRHLLSGLSDDLN